MHDLLAKLSELVQGPPPQLAGSGAADLIESSGNTILHMDNLEAIRRTPFGSIDCIFIDPPFASNATYHQQIRLPGSTITRPAYSDRWEHGITSYLEFLVPRLVAMKALLKPTGSICVHLDTHSSHYVKVALDAIYGSDRLINEVIWRYGKMSNTRRRFPQNHDTLLIYAASDDWYFHPILEHPSEYRTRFQRDLTGNKVLYGTVKHRADKLIQRRVSARKRELGRDLHDDDALFDFDTERKVQDDVFTDISIVRGNAHEGAGYDTQKPVKLLERLITALCPPDGVVADFFCGSGTTGVAAEKLGRRWILADRGLPAIQTARLRLSEANPIFLRSGTLRPSTFEVSASGDIVDFRIDDLGLSSRDAAAVRDCLDSAPHALVAGVIGGTYIDVFGREATPIA